MKTILLAILFASSFVQAASDSVGVFHRPEKVIVLINETGSATRLRSFIQAMGSETGFNWLSADESLKIQCVYHELKASCTFRLLPSSSVNIADKKASAEVSDFPGKNVNLRFESSQKDIFELVVSDQTLKILASKR